VYNRRSKGRFFQWRRALAVVLLALYTVLPFVKINGTPAMLLDIPARRFTLFGTQFWATDTLLLALTLIAIVVGIVALTALFGRVWCGWGCPQTVYMEFVFRPIENWLEGQGEAQRKFDAAPWTRDKWLRKLAKWGIFLGIAMVMAHTFLAYFVGVDRLRVWMTRSPIEHPLSFLVMVGVTGAILFDFLWFREQMCTLACPYGRLQAAMLDRSSLRVAYDAKRGEPRGKVQRGALKPDEVKHGDCVDCRLCFQTCPIGIDVRNGFQMECIGCTQCIDACDAVMDRVGRPRGLIRHTSEAELAGEKASIFRPRLFIYAGVLTVLIGTLMFKLETRADALVTLLRAVDEPYQVLPDGKVSNHLRLRVSNRGRADRDYTLVLIDPADGQLTVPISPLKVAAGEIGTVDAFVTLPAAALHDGKRTLTFEVRDGRAMHERMGFQFVGPEQGGERHEGGEHGEGKGDERHEDERRN
jgi:cytochrome c oxidase accessory protein FixG